LGLPLHKQVYAELDEVKGAMIREAMEEVIIDYSMMKGGRGLIPSLNR
jgi:hypothetical protein